MLEEFNFGLSELKFIADLGQGVAAFFGSILAIVASAQLFFREIDERSALTLLAKPVRRSEYLAGKFFGIMAVISLFCVLMTALIIVMLWSRETALMHGRPELWERGRHLNYAAILAVGFAHWLGLAVLVAFTLLIASFAQSSLFTVGVSLGVLVICQLQFLAQEAYAKAGTLGGRWVAGFIALLFPNFQVFNLGDVTGVEGEIGVMLLARVTGYALFYVGVAGMLAVFCFKRREI